MSKNIARALLIGFLIVACSIVMVGGVAIVVLMPEGEANVESQAEPEAYVESQAEPEVGVFDLPYILMSTGAEIYSYDMGADWSIWMTGDEGAELLKLQGGTTTLYVTDGYEVKVFATAGQVYGPNGACKLGNPISCDGEVWLPAGTYTFITGPNNASASIKVDVRPQQ